jgi:hypothetical protein
MGEINFRSERCIHPTWGPRLIYCSHLSCLDRVLIELQGQAHNRWFRGLSSKITCFFFSERRKEVDGSGDFQ